MRSLVELAAKECHVPTKWVEEAIRQGPSRVKRIKIPKKDPRKFRYISRPSSELEVLQRWLVIKFFHKLPVHPCATAFRQHQSILTNARAHQKSAYFVRVDFSDFFPSVKFKDLVLAIKSSDQCRSLFIDFDDAEDFIKRICFDFDGSLPIGYISSPVISNAVMYAFDKKLQEILNKEKEQLGAGVLTRYADDIVFSTDIKGGCKAFVKILSDVVSVWAAPRIVINQEKTIFSSRAGGSAIVTGLRICNDGHITINRKYKDAIRLMLSLHSKGKLDSEDIEPLRGHLNYVKYVAPAFFSVICAKYPTIVKSILT